MNIENAHKYTISWFLSALIARKDKPYIEDKVDEFFPSAGEVTHHRQRHAQAMYFHTNKRGYYGINGTDGTLRDWVNNFKACTNKYFHRGISDEYFRDLSAFILDMAETDHSLRRPMFIGGLSQGCSSSALSVLDIREHFNNADVEGIGFCGPKIFTSEGVKRMKKAGCRFTHIINPGDIVDNLGGIEVVRKFPPKIKFNKRYGHTVKLPKTKFHVFMGHAWSSVADGLIKYYENSGMKNEIAYIKAVKHIAKE